MTLTEKQLKEANEKLEAAQKDLEAKKEQFAKEMREKEISFKDDLEKAHKAFEEHVEKQEARLREAGKAPGGLAPKSVFKCGPTPEQLKKKAEAAAKKD